MEKQIDLTTPSKYVDSRPFGFAPNEKGDSTPRKTKLGTRNRLRDNLLQHYYSQTQILNVTCTVGYINMYCPSSNTWADSRYGSELRSRERERVIPP